MLPMPQFVAKLVEHFGLDTPLHVPPPTLLYCPVCYLVFEEETTWAAFAAHYSRHARGFGGSYNDPFSAFWAKKVREFYIQHALDFEAMHAAFTHEMEERNRERAREAARLRVARIRIFRQVELENSWRWKR